MHRSSLHLADLCALGWLAGCACILLLFGGSAALPRLLLYLLAGAGIVLLTRLPAATRQHTWWRSAVALYPVLLVAVAWGELRLLIPLPWDGEYWATGWAVSVDRALFGFHPTAAVQRWHRPWLDELMALVYVSYYLFLALPLVLLARRRWRAARAAAAVIALTYTVNFAIFVAVPLESPPQVLDRWPELLPASFGGWLIAAGLRALQSTESVRGAAFPASHVAGSVACAMAALEWAPRLGRVLLPLSLGVAFATVYLGYHHAIDPLAGIVWGAAGWALARIGMRARGELPE